MVAVVVVGVVLLAGQVAGAARGAPPGVALVHSLLRVRRDSAPPVGHRLRLTAARNEWASFQVVVSAGGAPLAKVRAAASTLRGPRGAVLPAPALYREHFVRVAQPTTRCKEPPAWWPDALIPLVVPASLRLPGEPRFRGSPFDIAAGRNQPLYAELRVPDTARPGTYRGEVAITAAGQKPIRRSYTLTVWRFALPRIPACASHFGGFWRVAEHSGLKAGSAEGLALVRRYERALAEHRLMAGAPEGATAPAGPDGTPDMAAIEPVLRDWFDRRHASALQMPLPVEDPLGKGRDRALRYLRSYYGFLKSRGWADRAYTYLIDEPNDQAAYQRVRSLAALVHEADPGIRFLCTEQPVPSEPAWGSLVGSVDIWCPLWGLWDDASVRERLRAGDRVWSYTALCQGQQESPFWEMDFPLLNYRVASWQNWISGSTGLLYWTTVFWEQAKDPWTNPRTYEQYNGEGMLFYPGRDAGLNGPVASLRLKAVRDGTQDYDYCALLAAMRGRAAADAVVRKVARGWFDWERSSDRLLAARDDLARAILGTAARHERR